MKLLLLCLFFLLFEVDESNADVAKYHLEFSQSDIDMIYANPHEDIYITGTIRTQGSPITCRMRVRGDGTRNWPKKSVKVVFDGETLDGREKINFNAEYEDYTYLNSVISSQIYRSTGHPCFKASHAALYLNGNFWGLFVRIENVDDEFLNANSLSPDDDLYKATFDGACLSDYDDIDALWEKKTNESTGRQNLQDLIDTLNTTDPLKFKDFAQQYFDYDKMLNFISVNLILSNFSTYYHNYYMFQRVTSDNKWMPIPWDMDKTFYKYGLYTDILNSSNYRYPDNPMLEWSFMDDRVKADIISRVEFLLANKFRYDDIVAKIDSLQTEIRQYVEMDQTDNVASIEDWEAYISKTKDYIKDRPQHLLNQLNYYPSNFRVEQIDDIVTEPPTISWEKSVSPSGRKMTYQIRYNKSKNLADGYDVVDNIDALRYTFPSDFSEGKYYYEVLAFDQYIFIEGTDNNNYFIYKKPDTEYCTIDSEVRFTIDNSPYVIDCDMTISKNGKLVIDPGVEVYVTGDHLINAKGILEVNGTSDKKVIIKALDENGYRNRIVLSDGADVSVNFCDITNVAFQAFVASLEVNNSSMFFSFEALDDNRPFIDAHWGTYFVRSCTFNRSSLGLDGIIFWNSKANVEDCVFENIRDATELVACEDSKVLRNIYYSSKDDAIDCNGGTNLEIANNIIYNAFDKGISIGNQNDTLSINFKVHHNIIVGCGIGTSFKDNSQVDYYNNTLYKNKMPLEALRMSTGLVTVRNTIFSQNEAMPQEALDKLQFSYNLSNQELLPGNSNLQKEAMLADPEQNDFSLLANSPAIDSGDPASPNDADGTRADIGAKPYSHIKANVVINEIHYNQDDIVLCGDWVELYNNSEQAIDISNWYFSDSDDNHKFIAPEGTVLPRRGFTVLVEDAALFAKSYPYVTNYIGSMGFGLSGGGELVRLYDSKDNLVDYVEYDDKEPWPTSADGDGYTLSLIDPDFDNALPESWYASEQLYGTPGKANNGNSINEEFAKEGFNFYPLPAKDYIVIESKSDIKLDDIQILDNFGKIVIIQMQYISENSISLDLSSIVSGVYFITINNNGKQTSGSFIKVK